jgi:mycobactin peptide synthetase MbtE
VPELRGSCLDYPLDGRVDSLVARWAEVTPEATALRWGHTGISYRQLSMLAEAERRVLAEAGIGRGDVVAVRLPRGPRLVAVMLGVMATGAAYAGGSVDWPRERFDAIALRCSARAIIDEQTPAAPVTSEPLRVEPGASADPCCVFSTSGSSSGQPRAVLVPHSGTTRCAFDPAMGFSSRTRMWQISPLGWDAMSLELWGPLINGGTSVLYTGTHPGPSELRAEIADGLTSVFLTTSLFNAFVEEDVDAFAGLERVITGGERISPTHVRRLRSVHPGLGVVNIYGPAECSIMATRYSVPPGEEVGDIPIGEPVPNTSVLLRDNEVLLGGDCVGIGYLGEPEATEERFEVGEDGLRWYRTGDLGSIDAQGRLVFAGRADRQFKIRGTRIAPEEVEAAMDGLPGVWRSVLLPVTRGSVTETLACYVGTARPDTVRAHLARSYPAAFVPRTVLGLERMPTTSNGKLDTAALIAMARSRTEDEFVAAEPVSPAVARVAAAASELLGTLVGPDTDLFDAGADSITVIRLAGRLGLTAAGVLTGRTPRLIAATAAPRTDDAEAGQDLGTRWVANLPLTQYRMWWTESHHPGNADMINQLLFEVDGELDTEAFAAAIRAVVARHEALRTTLRPASRRWIDAVPAADLRPECPVVEHSAAAVGEFIATPFDLAEDLPLRARIFRIDQTRHLVALTVHHVAYDGWSEALLCADLSAAYAGTVLPGANGFRDVALDQIKRAPSAGRFWFDHLAGVPEIPLVPPGAVNSGAGPVAEHRLSADALDHAAVQRICARYRVTDTVVYLAAWVWALRGETQSADFALGMPLSGRTIAEADEVIGCFASSAVLRFPDNVATIEDCLAHGAALLERLLLDQYVPLERILAEQQPPGTGRNPFCQVGFVMQNMPPGLLELGPARVQRRPVPRTESLFELALEIHKATGEIVIWHRTDVVAAERVARLAEGWRAAIDELALEQAGAHL